MSFPRLLTTITLVLCGWARSAMSEPGTVPQQPAAAPASTAVAHSDSARVVFVNVVGDLSSLSQTIADLLLEQQILPHFEYRQTVTEERILEPQVAPTSSTVWIVMPRPDLVRLVFADSPTRRFLVRDIPLPHGLDELGRETIAQVVQSSMVAMLRGSVGMSRAEIRHALLPFLSQPADKPQQPEAWHAYPLDNHSEMATARWRVRVGASYQATLAGRDFGPEHGPGIMAGLEYLRPRDSLIALGAFEWRFQKAHQNGEFQVAVQNSLAWLLLGWRKPNPDACLIALLGPGLQLSRVRPAVIANDATASVGEQMVHVSPWFRIAMGLEWEPSMFVLQLLGKMDLAAFRTHYDIERNGVPEQLASSWLIQPGISLAALWR